MRQGLKDYIKLEDLKDGYLYKILARNAGYGIYCDGGFYISRWKFGRNYIFVEIHWDLSDSFGTVKPLKEIEISPFSIKYFDDWKTPRSLQRHMIVYLNSQEKCPCGGSHNDWHSHASDCIVIDRKGGKDYAV